MFLRCMPYMEQVALYDTAREEFQRQPYFIHPVPHAGFSQPIALLGCPSDGRMPGPQLTHENLTVGLTSYLGVVGENYLILGGVFYVDSSIRLSQITDGTSQTVMLGERPPSSDFWFGWWYAGAGQNSTGSADMLLGAAEMCAQDEHLSHCQIGPHQFQRGKLDEQCDALHFWALHPGGANFAFADGSVRFLSYSAAEILPKLATRAGAEPVTLP